MEAAKAAIVTAETRELDMLKEVISSDHVRIKDGKDDVLLVVQRSDRSDKRSFANEEDVNFPNVGKDASQISDELLELTRSDMFEDYLSNLAKYQTAEISGIMKEGEHEITYELYEKLFLSGICEYDEDNRVIGGKINREHVKRMGAIFSPTLAGKKGFWAYRRGEKLILIDAIHRTEALNYLKKLGKWRESWKQRKLDFYVVNEEWKNEVKVRQDTSLSPTPSDKIRARGYKYGEIIVSLVSSFPKEKQDFILRSPLRCNQLGRIIEHLLDKGRKDLYYRVVLFERQQVAKKCNELFDPSVHSLSEKNKEMIVSGLKKYFELYDAIYEKYRDGEGFVQFQKSGTLFGLIICEYIGGGTDICYRKLKELTVTEIIVNYEYRIATFLKIVGILGGKKKQEASKCCRQTLSIFVKKIE